MGFWDIITDAIKGVPESAALRERLALAADQYTILEGEITDLKKKYSLLETENQNLRLDLGKAKEQIRDLEEQLSNRHSEALDKIATQILLLVADHPDCTTEALAHHLKLHPEKVLYYRDELTQQGYLDYGLTWDDQEYYQLTPKGRKTLSNSQLL